MAVSILEGMGEATVEATPAAAFAFLSDPRNAGLWFAGSGFAQPPEGAPRAGMIWRFERMRGARGPVTATMSAFEPPERFVWETRVGILGVNNVWELRFEQALVDSGSPDVPARPGTIITMTIRLRPRPLGWLSILPALPLLRGQLPARAQRAADRAAEAVQAHTRSSARKRLPSHSNPRRERRKPRRR